MGGVLVFTGVEFEAAVLARALGLLPLGGVPFRAWGGRGVRLAPAGLRAALLARRWRVLADGLPAPLVISAGVCGALDASLAAGDLVVPDTVLDPGGRRWPVTAAAARARVLETVGGREGLLASSGELVATAEAKRDLGRRTGAIAVDMESHVVLATAVETACPALVLRGVSDEVGRCIPAALLRVMTADGRLRVGRALATALSRPHVVPQALALRQGTRRGLAAVAGALAGLAA